MSKLFVTFIMVFAFPLLVLAQSLAADQAEGYIIDKKGNRYEGIIELASLAKPWQNQEKVYFIEKSALGADGKISKKEKKKFDTKDLAEYQFGTRRFVLIEYTNIEGATKASGVNRFRSGLRKQLRHPVPQERR